MRSLTKAAKQLVTGKLTGRLTFVPLVQLTTSYQGYYPITFCPFSPYDGKWSKTMVGFGPEDDHFVAELTYNYGVGEYQLGNDFLVGDSSFYTSPEKNMQKD